MNYAPFIFVQCTSTMNHALCTLVYYISTMHCVDSCGTHPPWTVHFGTMHFKNESSIAHVSTLDFHYVLCSFLECTSCMHYAPWWLKYWVLLYTVHLRMVQFHCVRCTIHFGVVQFHYAPYTVHLVTFHFHHEIWTVHHDIMHVQFIVYTLVWCSFTIHLALCTL